MKAFFAKLEEHKLKSNHRTANVSQKKMWTSCVQEQKYIIFVKEQKLETFLIARTCLVEELKCTIFYTGTKINSYFCRKTEIYIIFCEGTWIHDIFRRKKWARTLIFWDLMHESNFLTYFFIEKMTPARDPKQGIY